MTAIGRKRAKKAVAYVEKRPIEALLILRGIKNTVKGRQHGHFLINMSNRYVRGCTTGLCHGYISSVIEQDSSSAIKMS